MASMTQIMAAMQRNYIDVQIWNHNCWCNSNNWSNGNTWMNGKDGWKRNKGWNNHVATVVLAMEIMEIILRILAN
jgi:hypothetical protein